MEGQATSLHESILKQVVDSEWDTFGNMYKGQEDPYAFNDKLRVLNHKTISKVTHVSSPR